MNVTFAKLGWGSKRSNMKTTPTLIGIIALIQRHNYLYEKIYCTAMGISEYFCFKNERFQGNCV